ncbi:MAG: biopolymer transporter ExbD, partial [Bacteroidetes bacterium]|nr:biopolymer transporter ExbD [Bacteroidota bacterium]
MLSKRDVPEIPNASMADIAFMLLIFFLVATTMDIDSGLNRKLPPPLPPNIDQPPPIK